MFNAKFDEFGSPEMENYADDFEAREAVLREIAEDTNIPDDIDPDDIDRHEAQLCTEACEAGIISPREWNDGDFDLIEIAEKLGYNVMETQAEWEHEMSRDLYR